MPDSHNGDDFLLTLHVQVALLYVTIIHVPSEMLQMKKRVCIANHRSTLEGWASKWHKSPLLTLHQPE